jgi:hypothetical protein
LFTVAALARRNALDLGLAILCFAIAVGAKHSGPLVAVAIAIVCLLVLTATRREPRLKTAVGAAILLFAGAWVLLWAMYGFRFLETSEAGDRTNTALAVKIADVHSPVVRIGLNLAAAMHVVPRAYIWGLADTVRAGAEGRGIPVLLLGKVYRDHGPFYHWPVVIFAKLPLGLTLLILLGVFVLIRYGVRDSWRLPLAALAVLSAVFLFFMIRGAAYGGVRHALPLFPALAVIAAIACVEVTARRTRAGMVIAAFGVVIAAVSALPAIRPWEYYNEVFGGPEGAYRHFADEGIDVGQRTKDLTRLCKEQFESHGISPYVLYPISPQEEKRRGLLIHSNRSEDLDHSSDDPLITGTFLVHAKAIMRNDEIRALRYVQPSGRIGNLLIYTGTYRLPALRIGPLRRKIEQIMRSDAPDLRKAEGYLYRLIKLDPQQPGAYVHLGNINLARHATAAAAGFYSTAASEIHDPELHGMLERQIDLLQRGAWQSLKPIRLPERE